MSTKISTPLRLVATAGADKKESPLVAGTSAARCDLLAAHLTSLEASDDYTCAEFPVRCLVRCAEGAETAQELTLAWRVLAHCACYFADSGRLVTEGVGAAASRALVSPLATVASRRAVTRTVEALVTMYPAAFAHFLSPAWLDRLCAVGPSAVARAVLHVAGGLVTVTELLPWLCSTVHPALGCELAYAMLDDPGVADHVRRRVVGVLLVDPLRNAAVLYAVVWHNEALAGLVVDLHHKTLLCAVEKARVCDDPCTQLAVLNLANALREKVHMMSPSIVVAVASWACEEKNADVSRAAYAFAVACSRESPGCASAVVAECALSADALDNDHVDLLVAVCSHATVVDAHASRLVEALRSLLTLDELQRARFVTAAAQTRHGAALVSRAWGEVSPCG
jgi:hypothetical protein